MPIYNICINTLFYVMNYILIQNVCRTTISKRHQVVFGCPTL